MHVHMVAQRGCGQELLHSVHISILNGHTHYKFVIYRMLVYLCSMHTYLCMNIYTVRSTSTFTPQVTCDQSHCMYKYLYYNNGKWWAVFLFYYLGSALHWHSG